MVVWKIDKSIQLIKGIQGRKSQERMSFFMQIKRKPNNAISIDGIVVIAGLVSSLILITWGTTSLKKCTQVKFLKLERR